MVQKLYFELYKELQNSATDEKGTLQSYMGMAGHSETRIRNITVPNLPLKRVMFRGRVRPGFTPVGFSE